MFKERNIFEKAEYFEKDYIQPKPDPNFDPTPFHDDSPPDTVQDGIEVPELPTDPLQDINMETEASLSRIDNLFKEAFKDIKLQVQAPTGYALIREPETPDNYTVDTEQFPPEGEDNNE